MPQRPLSLKRERAQISNRSRISNLIAEVLVDNEVFHLNQTFSYGIPDSMIDDVRIGSKVKVPFRSSEKLGVVKSISRREDSVKQISKVVNSWAFSEPALRLAEELAHRYGSNQWEILSAIPSRSDHAWPQTSFGSNTTINRRYIPIRQDSPEQLLSHLKSVKGSSLVLFPTEREARYFFERAVAIGDKRCIRYFGMNSAKITKEQEDAMRSGESCTVVACRIGVLLQISNLAEIVIVDEQSEDFWEQRRPYWNVRDVALVRSRLERINLTFLCSAPSLELTRLIDIGFLAVERKLPKFARRNIFHFEEAGYVETIRRGLQSGSVLVSVAEKSYTGSFLCAKCRNSPNCSCGALLRSRSRNLFECKLCGFSSSGWTCNECGSSNILFLRKGAERIYEELGKVFPQTSILISTADKPIQEIQPGSIVIATPGMHPLNVKYGALVLLDGWLFLSRPGLRAEETLRRFWFRLLSLVKQGGYVYVSLPRSNGISQDLLQNNALRGSVRQLLDRQSTKLPPSYRVLALSGNNAPDIALNLKGEFPSIEISRTSDSSSMVIRARVEEAQSIVDALVTVQRYRSAARQDLLKIQVDPYDV